jgi:hypothetical protein
MKFTSDFVPKKFGNQKYMKVQNYVTIKGKKYKLPFNMWRQS